MVLRAGSPAPPSQPGDPEARVLDAAARLFAERGVQAVGMDAIRDAAGVSLKRLYALFPAKERLVAAVLARRDVLAAAELAAAGDPAAPPRERILAVFDLLGAWAARPGYRGCEFINAYGELGGTSSLVAEAVAGHKRRWRDAFAGLVAEAGGPDALAEQLAILANGAMVMAGIERSAAPAAAARAAAEALLDAGLAPGAGARR